ncbi:polysaccharide pyruvyl transferase CsaB [Desulfuribacillus stibiiarsenatis]|uniref:Polysaccharide pyruvyl transferase CsaB n=1 Tax=Desulfuribacillus stibiiarsenatis TaxID=1390249 RepID=A0A1E5L9A2_9FIRM|nr:polysaccharide pyruvyl transferase CsaB [Desulfuribacillus stibiiarsenatis]OEH86711.1 polysaccharide pyruvyl transferase CsaB [Desulfuribacillus stibiiarsenatis]
MPRILISGYYGFNNTGDDTVLDGIITALQQGYSEESSLELAVLSNQPELTAKLFGIQAYNRWSLSEIYEQLKKSDLLIMGGGSLLQDVTSPRSVIYYLGIAWLAKKMGKPIVFYAQGIGPITHSVSKHLMKHVANKVDIITVRDYKSLLELQGMGIHNPPMYLTTDPALAINPSHIDLTIGKRIFEKYGLHSTERIAGISIRVWRKERAYLDSLAAAADSLVTQGWKVVFIPMHHPMDIAPSQEIIRKMKHYQDAILIDEKNMNFRDVVSMIGNVQYMIGMRLHALILAGILGIPFTALSYDPKIDRFVESVGYPMPDHVETITTEKLLDDVSSKINHLEAQRNFLVEQVQKLKPSAQESARLALNILRDKNKPFSSNNSR